MTKKIPFLRLIARKLNVNAKEVARFLEIDKRTLYNYANYSLQQLPLVVKEKFLDFFSNYNEFESEDQTINGIANVLEVSNADSLVYISEDFIKASTQRSIAKKNKVVELSDKRIRSIDLLDELLEGFGISISNLSLSRGYIYSLIDVVFSKVDSENDYKLLEYINQYKKEDND